MLGRWPVVATALLAGVAAAQVSLEARRMGSARFNSIWQRQPDGRWLVVFDKGGPP